MSVLALLGAILYVLVDMRNQQRQAIEQGMGQFMEVLEETIGEPLGTSTGNAEHGPGDHT